MNLLEPFKLNTEFENQPPRKKAYLWASCGWISRQYIFQNLDKALTNRPNIFHNFIAITNLILWKTKQLRLLQAKTFPLFIRLVIASTVHSSTTR